MAKIFLIDDEVDESKNEEIYDLNDLRDLMEKLSPQEIIMMSDEWKIKKLLFIKKLLEEDRFSQDVIEDPDSLILNYLNALEE